jgi:hypothetical protein
MENENSQNDWFSDHAPPHYKLETLVLAQPVWLFTVYKSYALLSCQI